MTISPATILITILIINSLAIIRLWLKVRRLNKTVTGLSALRILDSITGSKDDVDKMIREIMKKGAKNDVKQS